MWGFVAAIRSALAASVGTTHAVYSNEVVNRPCF
jgi:hypothetical protein